MRKKKQRMSNSARSRQRAFHMMLFLPVLLLFIFNYLPIFGLVMAFQDFQPGLGFLILEQSIICPIFFRH